MQILSVHEYVLQRQPRYRRMVGRGEDPEFYFSLAKDFINDIDGKDFKVEKYFTA